MYSVHDTWIYLLTYMHFIWWRGHYNHAWVPPYTRPTLPVSLTVVQSQLNVCPHIFRKALFIPVHTCMYQCCTSTYSHRSHSHFISNQAPSRLRPSRVSSLRLSDDIRAESCLFEVSNQYSIPHKSSKNSFKNRVCTSTYSVHISMTEYVLACTGHSTY